MLQSVPPRITFLSILKDNWIFTLFFCLWLIAGGLLLALSEHGEWVLYFNANRTPFWNLFFKYGTQFAEEYIFISLILLLALFVRFRMAIAFTFMALATLVVSATAKQIFRHPRPLRYFTELGTNDELTFIEGVRVNVGLSSFPSGHTLAAFAIYGFLAFNAGHKKISGVAFFAMALMVGISRIYLVQHFLEDIYLGSVLGVLLAAYFFLLQQKIGEKPWLDRNLLNLRKSG
ncbi:MAG: hypothetical protein Sapg2KO_17560 [Saprospiraceae bacterium]